MSARVTIGEFSTMTRLSRKALRHYHDLGLLQPATVDPNNGYRYYDLAQVDTARLIRRLRDLELPVPDLKSYLSAPEQSDRDAIVSAHLERMRAQLRQTEQAIDALSALLAPVARPRITVQDVLAASGIAITATVALVDVISWWTDASNELAADLRAESVLAVGPLGGLYAHELFADERAEITVWMPTDRAVRTSGRARMIDVPTGRFAVAVHDGADERIDDTYAALGRYVAERGIAADGPVRERYLAGVLGNPAPLVTEVAWPVIGRT